MQGHFVVSKLKTDQDSSYILWSEYFSIRGCVNSLIARGRKEMEITQHLTVYRGNVNIICDESMSRFVAIFMSSRHMIRPAFSLWHSDLLISLGRPCRPFSFFLPCQHYCDDQAFKVNIRLRELTSCSCSSAASTALRAAWLVWTQHKQEMSSLNLNLSLQAWWWPYRSNYSRCDIRWPPMPSIRMVSSQHFSNISQPFMCSVRIFRGKADCRKLGIVIMILALIIDSLLVLASSSVTRLKLSTIFEFEFRKEECSLLMKIINSRVEKILLFGKNQFMIPGAQNRSSPIFYGPSSAQIRPSVLT